MTHTIDDSSLRLIEEHVRRLLVSMGFDAARVQCQAVADADTPQLAISIEVGEAGKLLIGTAGNHLAALQHLVRAILRRQLSQPVRAAVDVNGYRARQERVLHKLAESAAARARTQGRAVVLRPMRPAERRLIHTALAAQSDVRTESLGDEPNRRVVIRPLFL